MYSEKQSCTQQGNIMGTTKSAGISCTPGTCITIIFRGIKSLRFEVNPENYQLCDIICKLNNWPFGSLHLNGSYSSREDWGSSSKGWNHETIRIELYSSVCMNESTLGVCVRGCWWLNCNPIFRRNVQFIAPHLKAFQGLVINYHSKQHAGTSNKGKLAKPLKVVHNCFYDKLQPIVVMKCLLVGHTEIVDFSKARNNIPAE